MSTKLSIPAKEPKAPASDLQQCLKQGVDHLFSAQHPDGFWWYTLEANDSINAEFIMLLHYLEIDDKQTEQGICRWILNNQREDGSWALYQDGVGDVSTTVECYMALKMAGYDINHAQLAKARDFILSQGGITAMRIFSRIHLAMFGLVDWKVCPNMPVALMQMPEWAPVNIYEFSSWARACIVPLLVIMDQRKVKTLAGFDLNELYCGDPEQADWTFAKEDTKRVSIENSFIQIDRALKVADRMKLKPLRNQSLKKCEAYIREHLSGTEDIFPAMFYGIIALDALGFGLDDITIEKALLGLRSFQIIMKGQDLHEVPFEDSSDQNYNVVHKEAANQNSSETIYQQCCVSPVWDTAWAAVAALDAGANASDERLITTTRWLLKKQILETVGDWAIKNPGVVPGGWSFEFENQHYPDLDDTIEVLTLLHKINLPYHELQMPVRRGLNWLLSMQCKNGGFAAFDKDNNLEILNKLPFSDHGACLDPATVDITGRVIEFLINTVQYPKSAEVIERAANFITERQESDGSFWGRWGVNYLYGTWCALEALGALGRKQDELVMARAVNWLKSIQNDDGGFGESCDSYAQNKYRPLPHHISTASQTAWGLMGYVGAGLADSKEAKAAADYLMRTQNPDGSWDEEAFTGTGFPGHFYIRYHGYRKYFPVLALAKYRKQLSR
ncbi:MAG: squalene--hopene cyclase [Deltaproteobacteria bacterium]|nr:squalene--hopene cyclase [Deltaproteobacteria bacterium]